MYKSAESVGKLVSQLSRLPGIGRKTAGRLAFHILKISDEEARELAASIIDVKEKVGNCSICFNISESDPCALCTDDKRDKSIICVVEEASDIIALGKAEDFNPLFHVLGGKLSPLDGIGPDDLYIKELLSRLDDSISEVVVATNPDVEGEATAIYLNKLIKPFGVKVTRIARGLPVGGDLEYADGVTITRALQGRQEL
ncbi:MAG: recombination protein RecR [candidate division Zixibacteria bacterium]|nr:recombination protein RecR [candidate division Zixibacteria bacterium]